jgi:hypothetical protein
MGFSGIVVLAAPKLYHEKPLSINLFGEGIVLYDRLSMTIEFLYAAWTIRSGARDV